MNMKRIETEQDYNEVLQRLEKIFDVKKGSPEGDELEILGQMLSLYEDNLEH